MTNRKARLAFLINFINENGVLGKVSLFTSLFEIKISRIHSC